MLTPLAKELAAEILNEGPTAEDFALWEDPEVRASDIHYLKDLCEVTTTSNEVVVMELCRKELLK